MDKLSPQTKSFIALFACLIIGTYFAMWIAGKQNGNGPDVFEDLKITSYENNNSVNNAQAQEPEVVVDTSTWKEYANSEYGFGFKYDPAWKVIVPKGEENGYYVFEVDPGRKYYNIKIYVSGNDFYVMDGLPTKQDVVDGGIQALNVSDLLYGIKKDPYFFTFDLGQSLTLKPQFKALVNSVKFTE